MTNHWRSMFYSSPFIFWVRRAKNKIERKPQGTLTLDCDILAIYEKTAFQFTLHTSVIISLFIFLPKENLRFYSDIPSLYQTLHGSLISLMQTAFSKNLSNVTSPLPATKQRAKIYYATQNKLPFQYLITKMLCTK